MTCCRSRAAVSTESSSASESQPLLRVWVSILNRTTRRLVPPVTKVILEACNECSTQFYLFSLDSLVIGLCLYNGTQIHKW